MGTRPSYMQEYMQDHTQKILFFMCIACVLALLTLPFGHAATLSGTVFTKDLGPAKFALLSVNTTPAQRIILENGTYSVTLPPGVYFLHAAYTEGTKRYEDNATLRIYEEGNYTYDFITLTSAGALGIQEQELPNIAGVVEEQTKTQDTFDYVLFGIILLLVIIIIIGAIYYFKLRTSARKEIPKKTTLEKKELKGDLALIIDVLEQEGGRTTQKELRKHIPCSEAKMSMMITELEHKGRVERIKKGRANLIVLKEE